MELPQGPALMYNGRVVARHLCLIAQQQQLSLKNLMRQELPKAADLNYFSRFETQDSASMDVFSNNG